MDVISDLFVDKNLTIEEALNKLNLTAKGILLLVDNNNKLIQVITDGDLRRLILQTRSLKTTLSLLPHQQSIFISEHVPLSDAWELLDKNKLNHIPVVRDGIPISIISRQDHLNPILLSPPHLDELEHSFIIEAIQSNWIAPIGPHVDAFENELAAYVNIPYAAAVSSGTSAIHLALRLLNITNKDVVFCSSLTFIASANPILYQGAIPVFIDSDLETWCMSPVALERAFADAVKNNKLSKAVIIVNLYGQSADMDALSAICNRYEVPIIEDAAESLGATYKGKQSGSIGYFGIYSFNGNKIITTSGGGMLVSHNKDYIQKAKFLATQAREPMPYYEHIEYGYNYRLSNILAAIGRVQLSSLEKKVKIRRTLFNRYVKGLEEIDCIHWMPEAPYGTSSRWLSVLIINNNQTSPAALINKLSKEHIEARHVWKPLHMQPLFKECSYYPHQPNFDVSEYLFRNGVCLPSGSGMTYKQQDRVIQTIKNYFQDTADYLVEQKYARN